MRFTISLNILFLVLILLVLVKDAAVHITNDSPEIFPTFPGHLLQLGRPCPCWGPPSPPWTRPRPTSPASWWPTTCTSDESPQTHISSVESNICPRPTTDNVYYHRKSELMNEKYRLTFLYSLWASSNCLYSSANSAQSLMQTTCLSSISWPHNCDLLKLNQFTSEMSSLVLQFGLENINLTTIYW